MRSFSTTRGALRRARKLTNDELTGSVMLMLPAPGKRGGRVKAHEQATALMHEIRERLKDSPWNDGRPEEKN